MSIGREETTSPSTTAEKEQSHHADFSVDDAQVDHEKICRRDTSTSRGLDLTLSPSLCGERLKSTQKICISSKEKFEKEERKMIDEADISIQSNPSTCLSHTSEIDGEETRCATKLKGEGSSENSETLTCNLSPAKKVFNQFQLLGDSKNAPLEDHVSGFKNLKEETIIHQKLEVRETKAAATTENRPSKRGTELKNLLREFKKFYIRDFAAFEKSSGNLKLAKQDKFCDRVQRYLESKQIRQGDEGEDFTNQDGFLPYSLGLVINPKLTLGCDRKDSSCTGSQNECRMLIQDLIFKFTLPKAKEFFKERDNQDLFIHFATCCSGRLEKFKSEFTLFKSLF